VNSYPRRLKADAILESVLEIRFEPDATVIGEVVVGRLADFADWKSFRQARLPTADIPAPIRRADASLRYQPSVELISANGEMAVRIGPQVLTYSRRRKYPGWDAFGPELFKVVDALCTAMPNVPVTRLGLRYINTLRKDLHGISTIADMGIAVAVDNEQITGSLNLNFRRDVGSNVESMTRIATVDLAQGTIPPNTTFVVDIDVYTPAGFLAKDPQVLKKWMELAHAKEKERFFAVLGEAATKRLRED